MTHSEFNAMLRREFYDQTGTRRHVKLPSEVGIRCTGNTACATLQLSAAAVNADMQDDAAAFEGWALVLMVWCGVQRIIIEWADPENANSGHYQRFLYRLRHFATLLGPEIVNVAAPERLTQCRVGDGSRATLNLAGPTR
jgi:hypothetical protein